VILLSTMWAMSVPLMATGLPLAVKPNAFCYAHA
jgi:hypothetical protein